MEIIKIIFLGTIQGLTEFLPVSSSGHLILFQTWFQMNDSAMSLDIVLHFGTLFSVLLYYRSRIMVLIKKPFSRYNGLLILTAIPAGIVGVFFSDYFRSIYEDARLLGPAFLVTALLLYLSSFDRTWFTRQVMTEKTQENLSITDVLWIGLIQCLAIFPGVSRSGSTISAGLFRHINKEVAAELSFLNAIILILGANILEIPSLLQGNASLPLSHLLIGFLVSATTGYLAISFMITMLKKRSLRPFAYYVAVLGIMVMLDGSFFHIIF